MHVHIGALGWNGMITFAAIYYLVPRLWQRERMYSLRMINWHFWLSTLGIVFYASALWVAGIMPPQLGIQRTIENTMPSVCAQSGSAV